MIRMLRPMLPMTRSEDFFFGGGAAAGSKPCGGYGPAWAGP
jgi:hypothetical protein